MNKENLERNFSEWVKSASLKELRVIAARMAEELMSRAEPGASHLSAAVRALDARIEAAPQS